MGRRARGHTLERQGAGAGGAKQKRQTGGPGPPPWHCRPPSLAPTLPGEPRLPPPPTTPAMKVTPSGWSLLCPLGEQSDTWTDHWAAGGGWGLGWGLCWTSQERRGLRK